MTRHKSKSRKPKKIPKSLKDKARKLGIRLTIGQETHVPKSEKTLRTQITNAEKRKKGGKRKYRMFGMFGKKEKIKELEDDNKKIQELKGEILELESVIEDYKGKLNDSYESVKYQAGEIKKLFELETCIERCLKK